MKPRLILLDFSGMYWDDPAVYNEDHIIKDIEEGLARIEKWADELDLKEKDRKFFRKNCKMFVEVPISHVRQ